MSSSLDEQCKRPALALRVGITGARNLNVAALEMIDRNLNLVLRFFKDELGRLAGEPEVSASYLCTQENVIEPSLAFTSPLARGADRMAAGAALAQGYMLNVPMPFSQAEYERDFIGTPADDPDTAPLTAIEDLGEFRALLARSAGQVELDGSRGGEGPFDSSLEGLSYEAVGRYVVRHSDVMIAVWDGEPSGGRGGTAEIVEYAARGGVPVWWIHSKDDVSPALLLDVQDLRDPPTEPQAPWDGLRLHLNRLIRPPMPAASRTGRLIHSPFAIVRRKQVSFVSIYFAESPLSKSLLWTTYSWVMKPFSAARPQVKSEEIPPGYWADYYKTADSLATGYAARYRSGYVLIIALTTLALISGALPPQSSSWQYPKAATMLLGVAELAMLVGVLLLLGLSAFGEWHRRSVEYRMLAELFRKQETLAPLGWALPVSSVQHIATKEWLWLAWLFAAVQRAAPLPSPEMASERQSVINCRMLSTLIRDQLEYHEAREEMARETAEKLENIGWTIFLIVLLIALVKVAAEGLEWNADTISWLRLAAITLPAISAALVTLRSYAELQLLSEQSFHMISELQRASLRVKRLNLGRPLVSQDLGSEAALVASLMLQDLHGWGQLFRGKLMEAS